MPEVIALDHVLVALNFSAKLCVLAFQVRCAELAANGFVLGKLLLQTGNLFLEPCNQPVCRIQSVDRRSKSSRSTATLLEKGTDFASIFSIAATLTC